ncbi:putative BYS1 domain protein [Lindgomyces ingoldianus]|uniref:BYS1 domain protein n=1 Tax=Lindgomyces ingoldianus TaxID=673940 RepID=A0ACB6QN84_9PLEO|nr:putative BYS1 domain protein [Lindgomyces ingoldianus]KAF2468361.1 putative BYS1 domain protein [Lindgomyces ingoldianus]
MRLGFVLLSIVSVVCAVPAVSAGLAVVSNNSTDLFYLWSVGDTIGSRYTIVPSGGTYYEPLHRDSKSGGIALKMTKTPNGLFDGSPQQIFAYNLDGNTTWYDLSTVFGEPFKGNQLEVISDTGESIIWPSGTHPGGSQVKSTKSTDNIFFFVHSSK